jgi:hypothetical protein
VDSKAVETFLKKYPKVKQIMTTLAQKNTDLMRGYKAFLKFKDKQEPYLGGRGEETSSATFGSKVFYKYDFGVVKGGWPELYQYIYTLRYGGLDGARVESVNEGRAFINAARKAKQEGKTEFEFNGKKYPVTLKEGTLNEDPNMNKKVKALLDKELKDLSKGRPNHLFAVMHILMGALTDANFHSESKKVPTLFGSKAKYEGDPMAEKDLIQMYQYDLGTDVANICKWDGKDIVNAVGFYVSMTIGRPMGEKIENLIV